MTATDELRRILDERGVEYRWDNGTATWYVDGVMYNAWGFDNERLTMSVCHLTPEQAIDATVGRGTCEADETETIKCWVKCKDEPSTERMELIHVMECSECGHTYEHVNGDYEFCPRCGKKRVDA